MDLVGEFHMEERNGKVYLVYHHPRYNPEPETQNSSLSSELLQPLYLCPKTRLTDAILWGAGMLISGMIPFISSPEYISTRDFTKHSVLPLFWCNNKNFEINGGCRICRGSNFGTDYYFCDDCSEMYHRECVQSPLKIKHPYHHKHSLQLYYSFYGTHAMVCLCCGREVDCLSYYCGICQVFMHPICAMKPILFIVDQPKRHHHPLTLFPRQTSLFCNVCGWLRERYPTYICVQCNFVAHQDCMYFPRTIIISRHPHRISYTSSLRSGKWSCGVCRQNIDGDYGAYTSNKCCDYAVHPICALGKDVWDGKDLEGVPEEDDITQDVGPFDMISEGVILHFLHDHHLSLQISILYDENKFCQACVLPIFEGNYYSCLECNFILHETCAKSPRKLQHALHPHPLTLKPMSPYKSGLFKCNACDRFCGGFNYGCHLEQCSYDLDIRCASISEPLDYHGHKHPLYLALNPAEKPICHVCDLKCHKQLNCITCNFVICIKCTTLPSKVRYKHDKHFLKILWGHEVFEKGWCEVCEHVLRDTDTTVIYWCDECCTIVHNECLFGYDPYLKHGQSFEMRGRKIQTLCKSKTSRPLCNCCKKSCQGKIFMSDNIIACSMSCALSEVSIFQLFTKDI